VSKRIHDGFRLPLGETIVAERGQYLVEDVGLRRQFVLRSGAICTLLRNERCAEHLARRVGIMGRAKDAKIFDSRRPTSREGIAMLDGEKASLSATAPLRVVKGALPAVAFPNCALDFDGHMARARLELSALPGLARSRRRFSSRAMSSSSARSSTTTMLPLGTE